MYKGRQFRVRPIEEIVEDMDLALDAYGGGGVRTIFLADGNTAVLPAEKLVAIGRAAHARFPELERITMYGSAKFLAKKTVDEWRRIAAAGITRVHSGLESGDGVTLEALGKGVTPDGAIAAYRHVMAAGIELSVYLMVGVAGVERSAEHARGSAAVITASSPTFVRLRTFVPAPGTPWHRVRPRLELPRRVGSRSRRQGGDAGTHRRGARVAADGISAADRTARRPATVTRTGRSLR
jgi:radical SAM superfamily enzyme YgiQ (UPF0313 family)